MNIGIAVYGVAFGVMECAVNGGRLGVCMRGVMVVGVGVMVWLIIGTRCCMGSGWCHRHLFEELCFCVGQ